MSGIFYTILMSGSFFGCYQKESAHREMTAISVIRKSLFDFSSNYSTICGCKVFRLPEKPRRPVFLLSQERLCVFPDYQNNLG